MSFDLTNKNIQDTFQNLLQRTGSDNRLYDLTGNEIGDLKISGSLTAQQYIVSSSVTNITTQQLSGSTQFGNSLDDTHQFTGSLNVTGSITKGNIPFVLSNQTGSFLTDITSVNQGAVRKTTSGVTGISGDIGLGLRTTDNVKFNHITASGNISSSGTILASAYKIDDFNAITISGTELLFGNANNWTKIRYGRQDDAAHKFIGNITASGNISSSGRITSAGLILNGLSNQGSEATAVMIDGSNIVGTRELGSNAFTSTTIGTTTNALTAGDGLNNGGGTFTGATARTFSVDSASMGGFYSASMNNFTTTGFIKGNHITASGNISASGDLFKTKFVQMTNSSSVIDTFNTGSFRSAKYTLQVTSASNYQVSELLVLHHNSTASNTEYAQINSGLNLINFTTDISNSDVRLNAAGSFISCSVRLDRTIIPI